MCKSAPRSRQITTPAPHHSVFYRPDALPAAQPTASKHWRHLHLHSQTYRTENTVHAMHTAGGVGNYGHQHCKTWLKLIIGLNAPRSLNHLWLLTKSNEHNVVIKQNADELWHIVTHEAIIIHLHGSARGELVQQLKQISGSAGFVSYAYRK